jgi:hypothetical protein
MELDAQPPRREALRPRRPATGFAFAAAACCALALLISPVLISHNQAVPVTNGIKGLAVANSGKHSVEKPDVSANSAASPYVATPPPTDATSAAADKLLAEEARQEKLKLAKQMPGLWSKAVNLVKAADPAAAHNLTPPAVMVAVNVADPRKAEANLRKWAGSAGAVVQNASGDIVLRFNSEKAPALLALLRKQGELATIGASGITVAGANVGSGDHRPMPAVPGDDRTAQPSAITGPGGSMRVSGAIPHTDTAASHAGKMITVVVTLGHI